MALQVVDRAMQSFGAEGLSQDQFLAQAWTELRTLRFADVSFIIPFIPQAFSNFFSYRDLTL